MPTPYIINKGFVAKPKVLIFQPSSVINGKLSPTFPLLLIYKHVASNLNRMTLQKETLSYYNHIEGYRKAYNPLGNLVIKQEYSPIIGNVKTNFIYDKNERISKKIIESRAFSGNISIVLKDYEYSDNQKIITHSNLRNRNLFNDLSKKKENWAETNDVFKIETFKHQNNLLALKNTKNLKNKTEITEEFRYDSKNNCTDYIKNGRMISNKEFQYQDSCLKSIMEYKYFKNEKYLAFSEDYFYDSEVNLTKIEKRGLYNSIMYLYNLMTYEKGEEFSTEINKGYYHFSEFLGYYSYESMLNENKDNFQLDFLSKTTFEKKKFDLCTLKKFDSRNDLIESYDFGIDDNKKTDRHFFVHDYTKGKFKDFELCMAIDKNDILGKNYIKKYYY